MTEYRLEPLTEENAHRWEEFNNRAAEGSPFHSLRWKRIIEESSEPGSHYLLLYRNSDVFGLFPFIKWEISIFRGLVPVTDPQRLPAVFEDHEDPRAMQSIVRELKKTTIDGKKIAFVCISTVHEELLDPGTIGPLLPWASDGDMVLDLSKTSPDQIWRSFSKKRGQRTHIRRIEKDGFEVAEARSLDDLKLFYQYYEANIRHIGGTLRPVSRFVDLWESMPDLTRITLLSNGALVGGGLFQLRDEARRTLYLAYLSLNRNIPTTYHVSRYLDWEAINWAWDHGYERVSFGAQHLDEQNPRYLAKKEFGARFQPWYSRMLPRTRTLSFCLKMAQRESRPSSGNDTADAAATV